MNWFMQIIWKIFGEIAKILYGNPAKEFFVVAITWTQNLTAQSIIVQYFFDKLISSSVIINKEHLIMWDKTIPHWKFGGFIYSLHKSLALAKAKWYQVAIVVLDYQTVSNKSYTSIDIDLCILTEITNKYPSDKLNGLEKTKNEFKNIFLSIIDNNKVNKLWVFPKDNKNWYMIADEVGLDSSINYWIIGSAGVQAQIQFQDINWSNIELSYLWQSISQKIHYNTISDIYALLGGVATMCLLGVQWSDILSYMVTLPELWGIRLTTLQTSTQQKFWFIKRSYLDEWIKIINETKATNTIVVISFDDKNKAIIEDFFSQTGQNVDYYIITHTLYENKHKMEYIAFINNLLSEEQEWITYFEIPERKYALQFASKIYNNNDAVFVLTNENVFSQDKKIIKSLK